MSEQIDYLNPRKEAQLEAIKHSLDNAPSSQELAERKISAFESLLRSL